MTRDRGDIVSTRPGGTLKNRCFVYCYHHLAWALTKIDTPPFVEPDRDWAVAIPNRPDLLR